MTRSGGRCEPFAVVNRDLRHRVTAPTKRFALTAAAYRDPLRQAGSRNTGDAQMAIGGKRNHRHIGICGEGPANYPEIAGFLVRKQNGASPRRWR